MWCTDITCVPMPAVSYQAICPGRHIISTPALHVADDGSYTNKNMLRRLLPKTTLIGRMGPVRWRAAGEMDLRLVVIRPVD